MNARTSRTRNRIKPAMKAELIRKYGACVDCGENDPAKLTGDHILGVAQGGLNVMENLTLRCLSCNSRRGILVQKAELNAQRESGINTERNPDNEETATSQ